MISQLNSGGVANTYTNGSSEAKNSTKESLQKADAGISSQGDTSKIEQIKSEIESGQYKINLEALSQKIVEDLL